MPRRGRHPGDSEGALEQLVEKRVIRSNTFPSTPTACQRNPKSRDYLVSLDASPPAQRSLLRKSQDDETVGGLSEPGGR